MKVKFEKISLSQWIENAPEKVGILPLDWVEIYENIILPKRKTKHSSGYDFHAPYYFSLEPGESIVIETGIKVSLKPNQELLLFPRSGMGFKNFARLANTIGKVDSDYYNNKDNEGHIFIKIRNEGDKTLDVKKGEAFAQGTIYQYCIVDDDSLEEGEERKGGIGSTNQA